MCERPRTVALAKSQLLQAVLKAADRDLCCARKVHAACWILPDLQPLGLRLQQVLQHLHVDLHVRNRDRVGVERVVLGLGEDLRDRTWDHADGLRTGVAKRVGLSGACLPVRHDRAVVALEHIVNDVLDARMEDVGLRRVRRHDGVKPEVGRRGTRRGACQRDAALFAVHSEWPSGRLLVLAQWRPHTQHDAHALRAARPGRSGGAFVGLCFRSRCTPLARQVTCAPHGALACRCWCSVGGSDAASSRCVWAGLSGTAAASAATCCTAAVAASCTKHNAGSLLACARDSNTAPARLP
mmetsp:Transcript_26522/g.78785  ORF Transcript_26522/g.78785 Transcript_26522/m.78785 type:complete len:297 (-) Transcript_26522:134-1024(-)